MKKLFCALLMMGLSSTALAAKPYYVCSLVMADRTVQADAEILIQFKDGMIAYQGETTGTCIGEVKYQGTDGHYGTRITYDGMSKHGKANLKCMTFSTAHWFATSEGSASILDMVELGSIYDRTTWAKYSCK
ncbi:hypothetical protein [Bdellovibrio sp. GT3]|uniref:hypothetical protein n=1 Tax=Bdellovibrio sp. GT3 TaxID=3136282 RepID=UPI0030F187FD